MSAATAGETPPAASRFSPGGWLWLLHHELRLAWRGMGGKRLWILLLGGGFIWGCLHLAIWGGMRGISAMAGGALPPTATVIAGGIFWLFVSIMLSQTVAHAVTALFDRGDLDLLLSSPLSSRTIFTVRGLGIAISAMVLPAFLLSPLAHVGLFVGRPGMVAVYPVVMAVALFCAAVGMALTMALVKLLGARRAKVAAQIFAALVGAGFFLISQVQTILPRASRDAFVAWFRHAIETGGLFAPESLLWTPVRAMQGEWLPLTVVIAVAVGAFCVVVNLAHHRFVAGSQESISGGRTGKTGKVETAAPAFSGRLVRVLIVKEWKLLVRDPQIISQTLLQILYLIPLMFVAFRGERSAWLIIPGFVMIGSMLAGNLAWLTIAAEEAPELVGIAPVPIARIRWIKAMAAVLPVLALLVPLALWWLTRDPGAALVLLFCCTGGMASAAICHIWNPRRGDRRNMKQRYKESKVVGIIETLGSLGWAGMAVAMNGHWLWLPLPMILAAAGPASAWIMGRAARRDGVLA
jgi:ABC-2 type transport system permease protein